MTVLRRVVEVVFWVLLVLGQAPGALLLLLAGASVRAHGVLAPALLTLLVWPAAETDRPARVMGSLATSGSRRRAGRSTKQ